MAKKILIIDGTYLAYRSYFALNKANISLVNDTGFSTNSILLFFRTLFSLIKEQNPSHLFVAFDAKGKTFRHEMYEEYKYGRAKMEIDFYNQLDIIKKIINYINIASFEKVGYEADDIIAKVCLEFKDSNKLIFSADQDLNQLIDDKTSIIKKNKDSYMILSTNNFYQIYGILPKQVVDYKAMIGDSSDNFLGIKGIGPKTAAKLLEDYGDVDNIYNNIVSIKNTYALKLLEYRNIVYRNKVIAKLVTDFEIKNLDESNLDIKNIKLTNEVLEVINELKLNSIKEQIIRLEKKNLDTV